MGGVKVFDAKDPEEIVTITFGFADEATPGMLSDAVVTVAVKKGADPDVAGVVNGPPMIDGAFVLQSVKLGADGADYLLRCRAPLTDGRILVRAAILPVRRLG